MKKIDIFYGIYMLFMLSFVAAMFVLLVWNFVTSFQ